MPVDTRATHYDDSRDLSHEPLDLTLGGSPSSGMAAEDGHDPKAKPLDRQDVPSPASAPTKSPQELHARLRSVDTRKVLPLAHEGARILSRLDRSAKVGQQKVVQRASLTRREEVIDDARCSWRRHLEKELERAHSSRAVAKACTASCGTISLLIAAEPRGSRRCKT